MFYELTTKKCIKKEFNFSNLGKHIKILLSVLLQSFQAAVKFCLPRKQNLKQVLNSEDPPVVSVMVLTNCFAARRSCVVTQDPEAATDAGFSF